MKHHSQTWTQILVGEIESHRRETGISREAFAQDVASAWAYGGSPQIGRAWKTDGDVFEQARVNGQRLYRWLDDVSKDVNLLPANVIPAILAALPEHRRIRVLNAQLAEFGLMVERIPASDAVAGISDLLAASIKEAAEEHQAMVALSTSQTPERIDVAEREIVESIAASTAALNFVSRLKRRAGGAA